MAKSIVFKDEKSGKKRKFEIKKSRKGNGEKFLDLLLEDQLKTACSSCGIIVSNSDSRKEDLPEGKRRHKPGTCFLI